MADHPDSPAPAASPAGAQASASLGAHSVIYLLGTALQGLGVLLVLPFATRLLGEVEYGKVATALVVVQMIGTVAAAGLPQVILREYHRGDDGPTAGRALAGTMVGLAVALGVLGVVLGVVLSAAGRVDLGQWCLVVAASAALTTVVAGQSLSRARLRPLHFLLLAIASTVVAHLSGLLAAQGDRSSRTYLTAYATALVVAAVLAVVVGRPLPPTAARDRVRAGVLLAAPLLPQAVAMLGLLMGDVLLANRLLGNGAAGNYQVALQLGNIPFVLAVALFNGWSPLVLSHPPERRWEWTRRTGTALLAVVVVGAGLVGATGIWLAHVVAGAEFDVGGIGATVAVLSLVAVLYMLYQGSALAVLDSEHTARLALAALTGLAVMVVVAVALPSDSGIVGIAVAKVAGYVVLAAITIVASWRTFHWPVEAWLAVGVALVATFFSTFGGVFFGTGVAVMLLIGGAIIAPRVLHTLRR
ncbi:lipopolysaccharide biosynthesis protein [Terrabacter terrigena]|uniref:Lipopolysaccharide biosynthesis protein n=1 Tax=Terrabacter terrigena TaxID=574718 RepID=A0ABW3MXH8_9MICO